MQNHKLTILRSLSWFIIRGGLMLVFIQLVFAATGNTKLDSLNTLLSESRNDSLRFNISLKIGYQWESIDFDSSMYYYSKCLKIADARQWQKKKAQTLINIGFGQLYTLNSKESIEYLKQGLDIYLKTNNLQGQLDTYYNLGIFYGHFENYIKAIESFNRAAALGLELENQQRLGMVYNNLGLMYQYSGNYDKANLYEFKALEIKENIKDNTLGITHVNIGLNYLQQQNFDKSLEHYHKALDLFKQKNDKAKVALCYKNIGDVYLDIDELEPASESYQKAFSIFTELKDQNSIARYYMVMGNIYRKQNLMPKAEEAYRAALRNFPENGSNRLLFYINKNFAELYLTLAASAKNKHSHYATQAISCGNKMNDIAKSIGSIHLLNDSYKILYLSYKAKNNLQKAIYYADKFMVSKDSLFSEQKQKIISNIQTKYETEKKELEIEFLNSENQLISTSLTQSNTIRKNQREIIFLLIIGFVIVLFFIVIIYRFYRLTTKSNTKLKQKNKIISRQKDEIEILLKEIHHRVKNNLQIVSSLLDLQAASIKTPETKATLLDAQSRLKSIALIHQMLSQKGYNPDVSFKHFVMQLSKHIRDSISDQNNIRFAIHIPADLQLNIETTLPVGLILNELLTNALKYAFVAQESGLISVSISSEKNSKFRLEVQDDGCGLPEDFNINKSKSLGLRLVRTLSAQLAGKLECECSPGAKFSLVFVEIENKS